MQSWKQSCIVFASLYGKPRVTRNGNKSADKLPLVEKFVGNSSYKLYAIPRKGNYSGIFFLSWKLFRYFFPFLEIEYNLYEEFPTNFSRTEMYAFIISVSGNTRFTAQTGKNDARLIPRLHPFFDTTTLHITDYCSRYSNINSSIIPVINNNNNTKSKE